MWRVVHHQNKRRFSTQILRCSVNRRALLGRIRPATGSIVLRKKLLHPSKSRHSRIPRPKAAVAPVEICSALPQRSARLSVSGFHRGMWLAKCCAGPAFLPKFQPGRRVDVWGWWDVRARHYVQNEYFLRVRWHATLWMMSPIGSYWRMRKSLPFKTSA